MSSDDEKRRIDRLIARVGLKDRQAFDELYDATAPKLYAVALRVLKNEALAEEALQETYVKIWRRADRFSAGRASPMSWIITVARNCAIDVLRRQKEQPLDVRESLIVDEGPTPEAAAIAASEGRALARCLEELPADRARLVRAAFFQGASYREIAETTGSPLGTVKSWMRRSLIALRDCIDALAKGAKA
ncbi:MAG: sigma-70 family RNA polymerase sigma factor [Parvularculaceae bacterium]